MYLNSSDVKGENLLRKRIKRKDVKLNVLLIGENGIGKKTLMNALCGENLFGDRNDEIHEELSDEFSIDTRSYTLNQDSYTLQLKISYTKNFGSCLDNSDHGRKLKEYIEREYKRILEEEMRINRDIRKKDDRIHVALYFIRPTCRGLSEFDIDVMKTICDRVNIIPLMAKGDTLTEAEVAVNRRLINKSIFDHNIKVFEFEDEEDSFIKEQIPFRIISSTDVDSHGNHYREFPWGTLIVEDTECEFLLLKELIFSSHLSDLKESTVNHKFESYRCEKLSKNFDSTQKV